MRAVLPLAALVWLLTVAGGAWLNHVLADRYGSPYAVEARR